MKRREDSCGGGGGGCGAPRPGEERAEAGHDHSGAHGCEHEHAPATGGCCGGHASSGGCCGGGASAESVLVFSRRQIRELDRLAVDEFAMPSILLMENAARGVAGVILEGLQGAPDPSVLVVCGPGNNGGDGLALARHLVNRGVRVAVVLAAEEAAVRGDSLVNLRIVRKMGVPVLDGWRSPESAMAGAVEAIGQPMVIADALLGTGVDRAVSGVMAAMIGLMNERKREGSTLVAVDVPSGLDCDTGLPAGEGTNAGPAVEADLTIALAGVKAGFLAMHAQKYVGELVVVDIGAPRELVERLGRPLASPHPG